MNSAVISDCGNYRYLLKRQIDDRNSCACTFIMLNPSTADAELDDPTIRRCIGYAKRENCSELRVVNLFGYRATKPTDLFQSHDPVGPRNDCYVWLAMSGHPLVIAAWGAQAENYSNRVNEVLRIVSVSGIQQIMALGLTKGGQPVHPLYQRKDAQLVQFAL